MAEIRVYPVPKGSIVHLHDINIKDEMMESLVEQLAEICGHREFLIVATDTDATVEVWGPDTDLEAKITDLLERVDEGDRP